MEVRKRYPLGKQKDGSDSQVPFNSAHKYQIKVVEKPTKESHWTVFLKGAPERIWEKCSHVLVNGRDIQIGSQEMDTIQEANITFAKGGQRVLGFASYSLPIHLYPADHLFDFKGAYDLDIPLDKFTFLGLMSIIDPPRDTVPDAINKCKTAGIKVIMVTGDHQLTAAAIARQIGIFEGESNLEMADRLQISKDEATEKSVAIVVNGDMLTQAELEDRGLPETEKGKKLERWLKKDQIVFARTSPEQKLYIVKGCQKLGYVVAVTGDGVNDSPAIKQADIGIAMGITGSDVAKDSADMILLNDDFSAIILGIEEGRKIFDNLKKSIAYILSSNIPEIIPFLLFILIQIPIPLSTVLILFVDLGTDLFPGISIAFEESELDIMIRMPRSKEEHLVTKRLICYSYFHIGIMQAMGGMVAYVLVMNDFGFKFADLVGIILKDYYPHNKFDVYDTKAPYFGNSAIETVCNEGTPYIKFKPQYKIQGTSLGDRRGVVTDWLFTSHIEQDLRMGYLEPDCTSPLLVKSVINFTKCRIFQISPISKRPVCYSTEALKYAQTASFFNVIVTQIGNSLAQKTRKLSLGFQGFRNFFMIFGWFTEFFLLFCLSYITPLNIVLGTRDLILQHSLIPGIPFSIMLLLLDETRKFIIRNVKSSEPGKPNWFARNVMY